LGHLKQLREEEKEKGRTPLFTAWRWGGEEGYVEEYIVNHSKEKEGFKPDQRGPEKGEEKKKVPTTVLFLSSAEGRGGKGRGVLPLLSFQCLAGKKGKGG